MAIGMPRDDRVMAPGAAAWALFPLRVTARYVRGGGGGNRNSLQPHTQKFGSFFFLPFILLLFLEGRERTDGRTHLGAQNEVDVSSICFSYPKRIQPTTTKKKKKKWIKIEKNNMKRIFIIRCILHRCTCCTAIYTCTHVEKYVGYYKYFLNLIGSQLKLMGQLGTGGGAREPGGNAQTNNVQ